MLWGASTAHVISVKFTDDVNWRPTQTHVLIGSLTIVRPVTDLMSRDVVTRPVRASACWALDWVLVGWCRLLYKTSVIQSNVQRVAAPQLRSLEVSIHGITNPTSSLCFGSRKADRMLRRSLWLRIGLLGFWTLYENNIANAAAYCGCCFLNCIHCVLFVLY